MSMMGNIKLCKLKRVAAFILALVLVAGLAGCGKSKEFVFIINEEEISKKQVDIFGFIYSAEHGLVSMDELSEKYDDGQTYEQHYKEELELDIIRTVLLNKEAVSNGVKIDSELKDEASKKTDALIEKFGEDRLDNKDIKRNDILTIYEWKVLGEHYAEILSSKSEDEKQNEDDDNASDETAEENDRYIKVFQVLFPTADFDDEGMVVTDNDGNIKQVSEPEKQSMRESAQNFSESAGGGEDIIELLKEYPASVRGSERILKYNDLETDYKKAIDSLSTGGVSDVIESKYGYYVVKLLEKNDEEHRELVNDYEAKLNANTTKDKLFDELYRKYIGNNNEYRNNDQWKLIVIDNYY